MITRLLASLRRLQNDDRGVVTVLGAMLLPVLIGMGALVTDFGQMWQLGRQVQNCADAAALAGAWELGNQGQAITQAMAYLNAQGTQGCASNGTPATYSFLDRNADGTSDALKVTVSLSSSFGFARLWGINSGTVTKSATAGKGTPSGFYGIEPFSLQVDPNQPCGKAGLHQYTIEGQYLQYYAPFTLKVSASNLNLPGNFQALDFGGNGANSFRDNVTFGYQGWVSSCDQLLTKTGNMVQPTTGGLSDRLANGFANLPQCATLLAGSPTRWSQCPRVLTIALIPPLENGKTDTQALTFAWFYLESYQDQGNNNAEVKGFFLDVGDRFAPPGGWKGPLKVWTTDSDLPFVATLID
jgi:Flp pilus assembly protein TadG